ncbi:hypothetical protein [Sporofaciens sp. JLR.KK001]|uniref:hypothetical protein n=1 Tax=Sporofaciens sp. JLR.KK001 TaxID=3112621 RepID=UPI002FF1ACFA
MENQKETANKGRRKMIIIAFVVLCAALVVCVVLLLQKTKPKELDRGFVDESNKDTVMEDMGDKVAEGMFECKMTTSWVFEDGKSESPNAYVANVENNLHTIYFDVYEKATEELLYSSPMLPVGTELDNIKLEKELQKGEYDAVVMYTLVDEDNEEVSTVGFDITISVNN